MVSLPKNKRSHQNGKGLEFRTWPFVLLRKTCLNGRSFSFMVTCNTPTLNLNGVNTRFTIIVRKIEFLYSRRGRPDKNIAINAFQGADSFRLDVCHLNRYYD